MGTSLQAEGAKVNTFLSGYKTYIVAGVTFLASLIHAWSTNDWASFAPYAAYSTGIAALRAAVSKVSS